MRPPSAVLAALLVAAPGWLGDVTGDYAGLVVNGGRLECHHTRLFVEDGTLRGRYWIDSTEPFEGTLDGFRPDAEGEGGTFVWHDRYGTGVEALRFTPDGFTGNWGDTEPKPSLRINARRGTGCSPAVS